MVDVISISAVTIGIAEILFFLLQVAVCIGWFYGSIIAILSLFSLYGTDETHEMYAKTRRSFYAGYLWFMGSVVATTAFVYYGIWTVRAADVMSVVGTMAYYVWAGLHIVVFFVGLLFIYINGADADKPMKRRIEWVILGVLLMILPFVSLVLQGEIVFVP